MAAYCPPPDGDTASTGKLACKGCGTLLASCTPRWLSTPGSVVRVSGDKVRLKCPACLRVRVWYPAPAG